MNRRHYLVIVQNSATNKPNVLLKFRKKNLSIAMCYQSQYGNREMKMCLRLERKLRTVCNVSCLNVPYVFLFHAPDSSVLSTLSFFSFPCRKESVQFAYVSGINKMQYVCFYSLQINPSLTASISFDNVVECILCTIEIFLRKKGLFLFLLKSKCLKGLDIYENVPKFGIDFIQQTISTTQMFPHSSRTANIQFPFFFL